MMAKDVGKEARRLETEIEQKVEADQPKLIRMGTGILLFFAGAALTAVGFSAIKPGPILPDLYAGGPTGGTNNGNC